MQSTREGYTPGWTRRSTGGTRFPGVDQNAWGINLITKGRALAGAFIGAITADVGTIGTTELAAGAVTQAKIASLAVGTTSIAAQAITSTKLGAGAVSDSNSWGTVETISTADLTLTKSGTAVLTKATTAAMAVTIPAPTNGAMKSIYVDSVGSGLAITLTCATTTVTFDGTNKTLNFNAIADSVILQGIGTTRWAVIASFSVTIS